MELYLPKYILLASTCIAFSLHAMDQGSTTLQTTDSTTAESDIHITTADGKSYTLTRAAADQLGVLHNMLEDLSDKPTTAQHPIPLEGITSEQFKIISPLVDAASVVDTDIKKYWTDHVNTPAYDPQDFEWHHSFDEFYDKIGFFEATKSYYDWNAYWQSIKPEFLQLINAINAFDYLDNESLKNVCREKLFEWFKKWGSSLSQFMSLYMLINDPQARAALNSLSPDDIKACCNTLLLPSYTRTFGSKIEYFSLSPDGTKIATYGNNGLEIFDTKTGKSLYHKTIRLAYDKPVAWCSDNKSLIILEDCGSSEYRSRLLSYDTQAAEYSIEPESESEPIRLGEWRKRSFACAQKSNKVAMTEYWKISNDYSYITIYDIENLTIGAFNRAYYYWCCKIDGIINNIAWSPDEKQLLVTTWRNGTSYIIDTLSPTSCWADNIHTFKHNDNHIPQWSPDNSMIATINTTDVCIYDARTFQELSHITVNPALCGHYKQLQFSPDSTDIAIIYQYRDTHTQKFVIKLFVWNITTQCSKRITTPGYFKDLQWSHDNSKILIATDKHTIVYDAAAGKMIQCIKENNKKIQWSIDDSKIITLSNNGLLKIRINPEIYEELSIEELLMLYALQAYSNKKSMIELIHKNPLLADIYAHFSSRLKSAFNLPSDDA